MKPTLQVAFACAVIALGAGRAEGQAVDTTAKGPEPTAAMLTPAMLDAGRKVFHGRGTCFACHGDKLQGGPVAPALTGPKWRHINGTFDGIIDRIDNGLPGTLMVPHPGGITESQIFMVAAYIYAVSHQLAKP
jgi:mono/diheme cytochrome c family protein